MTVQTVVETSVEIAKRSLYMAAQAIERMIQKNPEKIVLPQTGADLPESVSEESGRSAHSVR